MRLPGWEIVQLLIQISRCDTDLTHRGDATVNRLIGRLRRCDATDCFRHSGQARIFARVQSPAKAHNALEELTSR